MIAAAAQPDARENAPRSGEVDHVDAFRNHERDPDGAVRRRREFVFLRGQAFHVGGIRLVRRGEGASGRQSSGSAEGGARGEESSSIHRFSSLVDGLLKTSTPQLARRAVIGFTNVARRAGMRHANTATASSTTATDRNVSGSVGETP